MWGIIRKKTAENRPLWPNCCSAAITQEPQLLLLLSLIRGNLGLEILIKINCRLESLIRDNFGLESLIKRKFVSGPQPGKYSPFFTDSTFFSSVSPKNKILNDEVDSCDKI